VEIAQFDVLLKVSPKFDDLSKYRYTLIVNKASRELVNILYDDDVL
jgi:hypothetical protein